MATSKNKYNSISLEAAKEQICSWWLYIDSHPISELKDRERLRHTKNGGTIDEVVATVEQQGKFLQETLKNILLMEEMIKKLETSDENVAAKAKGSAIVPVKMQGDDFKQTT